MASHAARRVQRSGIGHAFRYVLWMEESFGKSDWRRRVMVQLSMSKSTDAQPYCASFDLFMPAK